MHLNLIATRDCFQSNQQWPSCHCAAFIALPGGRLLATFYAGAYEKAKDQAILLADCFAPSFLWGPARVVAKTPGYADGNPVLWRDNQGKLWLFYVTIFGQHWYECKVFVKTSTDGWIWSEPKTMREELGWMLRAKPLALADGTVLLPMYDERDNSCHILCTHDYYSWKRYGHVTAPQGLIQPALVAFGQGHLRMYMRNCELGGKIWRSDSWDNGLTWDYPQADLLPNPHSGIDVLQLADGALLMAYNDSCQLRTPLCLAASTDGGATWKKVATAASGPGEFSYPALALDEKGLVHLLFTYKRQSIRHCIYQMSA